MFGWSTSAKSSARAKLKSTHMLHLASEECLLHQRFNHVILFWRAELAKIVDLACELLSRLIVEGEMNLGRSTVSNSSVQEGVSVVKRLFGVSCCSFLGDFEARITLASSNWRGLSFNFGVKG